MIALVIVDKTVINCELMWSAFSFYVAPAFNLREILVNVVNHRRITKAKHLGYYNAFARLCYKYGTKFDSVFSKEEVLSW